jgi:hypothetical protein
MLKSRTHLCFFSPLTAAALQEFGGDSRASVSPRGRFDYLSQESPESGAVKRNLLQTMSTQAT